MSPAAALALFAAVVALGLLRYVDREAVARALGLWPVYGRIAYEYYRWALRDIDPSHEDAHRIGRRFTELRAEFEPRNLKGNL